MERSFAANRFIYGKSLSNIQSRIGVPDHPVWKSRVVGHFKSPEYPAQVLRSWTMNDLNVEVANCRSSHPELNHPRRTAQPTPPRNPNRHRPNWSRPLFDSGNAALAKRVGRHRRRTRATPCRRSLCSTRRRSGAESPPAATPPPDGAPVCGSPPIPVPPGAVVWARAGSRSLAAAVQESTPTSLSVKRPGPRRDCRKCGGASSSGPRGMTVRRVAWPASARCWQCAARHDKSPGRNPGRR